MSNSRTFKAESQEALAQELHAWACGLPDGSRICDLEFSASVAFELPHAEEIVSKEDEGDSGEDEVEVVEEVKLELEPSVESSEEGSTRYIVRRKPVLPEDEGRYFIEGSDIGSLEEAKRLVASAVEAGYWSEGDFEILESRSVGRDVSSSVTVSASAYPQSGNGVSKVVEVEEEEGEIEGEEAEEEGEDGEGEGEDREPEDVEEGNGVGESVELEATSTKPVGDRTTPLVCDNDEAVYNCLMAGTPVVLTDGRTMLIEKIVRQKLAVKVLSWNPVHGIQAKQVVGWHKERVPEQRWIQIQVACSNGSAKRGLVLTPDHKVFTSRGEDPIRADEICVGDSVKIHEVAWSDEQQQAVLGTLLGDSRIVASPAFRKRFDQAPSFSLSGGHTVASGLSQYKATALGPHVLLDSVMPGGMVKFGGVDYPRQPFQPFRSLNLHQLVPITRLLYDSKGRRRIAPEVWDLLTPLALAWWFMDDGCRQTGAVNKATRPGIRGGRLVGPESVTLAMCRYSAEDVAAALRFFRRRYGDQVGVGKDRVIRFGWRASRAFCTDVAPHVTPSLRFRFPQDVPASDWPEFKPLVPSPVPQPCTVRVTSVREYEPSRRTPSNRLEAETRFCITVEDNHNFFTSFGLVRNCRDVLSMCRVYPFLVEDVERFGVLEVYEVDRRLAHIALQMTRAGMPVDPEERERVGKSLRDIRDAALVELRKVVSEKRDLFIEAVARFQAAKPRKKDPAEGKPTWVKYKLDGKPTKAHPEGRPVKDSEGKLIVESEGPPHSRESAYAERLEIRKKVFAGALEKYGEHKKGLNFGAKVQQAAILQIVGVPLLVRTEKTGLPKIDKEVLEQQTHHHVARVMLNYTLTASVIRTFIENLPVESDGRLHPQWIVHKITGRWGSQPNCFDDKTEILTEHGWKLFSDLEHGKDRVAQFTSDQKIEFVVPSAYQRYPYDGEIVHARGRHIDLAVTPDHRIIYERRGKFHERTAARFPKKGRILQAGLKVGEGVEVPADELIVLAAVQADGWWNPRGGYDFQFKKPRKLERLRGALERLGWIHTCGTFSRKVDETPWYRVRLSLKDPRTNALRERIGPEKLFGSSILSWSIATGRRFLEELWHWDGNRKQRVYFNKEKRNVDVVQALACLVGWRTVRTDWVGVHGTEMASLYMAPDYDRFNITSHMKVSREKYNGEVFCVTVPSGMIVVRHGGQVAVVGQCQNLSVRAGGGAENLRRMFVAPPGYKLVGADQCLAAGTMVDTPYGETPIEKLQVGDLVYSFDGRAPRCRRVSLRKYTGLSETLVVVLDNGARVRCTGNHRWIFKDGKEIRADQLQPGDCLLPLRRGWTSLNHRVVAVERDGLIVPTYDIEVEIDHNFALSAGVFVHNSQLEARIIAADSQDPFLLDVFQSGKDIHGEIAGVTFEEWPRLASTFKEHKGKLCGLPPRCIKCGSSEFVMEGSEDLGKCRGCGHDNETKCDVCKRRNKTRDVVKRLEYGGFYGGVAETLWKSVLKEFPDFPLASVHRFLAMFNTVMSRVSEWRSEKLRRAIKEGEVRSPILGRRQVFPMGRVEPTVVFNWTPQSGGADLWDLGAIEFAEKWDQEGDEARLNHNGHDSVSIITREDLVEEVSADIHKCWEREWGGVKFIMEVKVGNRWSFE